MDPRQKNPDGLAEVIVQDRARDLGLTPEACLIDGILDPCTLVIFGASGDLAARKLVPALYNLYLNEVLPRPFVILGCGRTVWGRQEFAAHMHRAVAAAGCPESPRWDAFAELLHYQPLDHGDATSFDKLAERLRVLDRAHHTGGNRIFYLAVPPTVYQTMAQMLGRAGLSTEHADGNGWSRIVVEKPFGRDLRSSMALNTAMHQWFGERQIYRIDHYLAKETVQNILVFRFANAVFEPIWNRGYIEYVGILAGETLSVGHRAGYYEQSGVLRDMFQNHMMQLLSMTAMEPPSQFEADRVRDEKVKVFRSLKPLDENHPEESLILGQYGAGVVDSQDVPGYREEGGVEPSSLTPTFAAMRVFIDNWRWRRVPFYVVSGKRLARKLTQIVIQFKEVPHFMFKNILGERIMANRLILGIYPEERVTLTFQTKHPGARVCLRSVTMDFNYYGEYTGPRLEAYEKVLLDCIQGDHMLFWRQDGVEQCWAFLTPVLEECESCPERGERLHPYPAGSWGPEAARPWVDMIL